MAFKRIGVTLAFSGRGDEESAHVVENQGSWPIDVGQVVVRVNPKFYRPAEVDLLIGDPSKAKRVLGWEAKTTLEELCAMMVDADLKRNQAGFSF
jgi:GDPmannose 4,6-dehydratase